jgi:glycosyltransferase involved in cell wall biosynthesis
MANRSENVKKICYIGDAVIHTLRWVKYFADSGHEVHLISAAPLQSGDPGKAKLHVLKGFSRRLTAISTVINLALGAVQVRHLIKIIKPDILHAHYVADNGLLGMMSGFHPLVLSAWGSDILIDPKRFFLLKTLIKHTLREADLITTDGENTIREMLQLGADSQRIHLIYHGVDTQQFKPAQKNGDLLKKLEIYGSPVIISIRNLNPVYNVETVVKSIPYVIKQFPEATFIIAGDGVQKNYLSDMATALGVSKHTRFIGKIPHDELPHYLSLADIYVSTSLSDGGLSVSLAEAMACGLAPVVTDVGDNQKWIENGKSGFVVPIRNPELVAEKVILLLKNDDIRKRSGEINRRLVEEKASYEKEMEKTQELYELLLK